MKLQLLPVYFKGSVRCESRRHSAHRIGDSAALQGVQMPCARGALGLLLLGLVSVLAACGGGGAGSGLAAAPDAKVTPRPTAAATQDGVVIPSGYVESNGTEQGPREVRRGPVVPPHYPSMPQPPVPTRR